MCLCVSVSYVPYHSLSLIKGLLIVKLHFDTHYLNLQDHSIIHSFNWSHKTHGGASVFACHCDSLSLKQNMCRLRSVNWSTLVELWLLNLKKKKKHAGIQNESYQNSHLDQPHKNKCNISFYNWDLQRCALVEDQRQEVNLGLTRQCPVTSWHCEACPWHWQASHTPLYKVPLSLRKPGMQAWNTQNPFRDSSEKQYTSCNALPEHTSQEVPAYPTGQEQISTAEALWFPWMEGLAICIENEWSLRTQHKHI